jgi:hypothetical protein
MTFFVGPLKIAPQLTWQVGQVVKRSSTTCQAINFFRTFDVPIKGKTRGLFDGSLMSLTNLRTINPVDLPVGRQARSPP